jgi:hypothetical protein
LTGAASHTGAGAAYASGIDLYKDAVGYQNGWHEKSLDRPTAAARTATTR